MPTAHRFVRPPLLAFAVCTLAACGVDPLPAQLADPRNEAPAPAPHPLLAAPRARTLWAQFCDGAPDEAVLPPDPRTRIVPGVNAGRAVHFNGWWEDCHVNIPDESPRPTTCGEWRAQAAKGLRFLIDELPIGAMSADDFNRTWERWGLSERPENFDQLYTLRYGVNPAPFHNPYPLPGEDPRLTNGGSGRLPLGLRQLKDADGHWTGQIGTAACFLCHGGAIGDPFEGEEGLGLAHLGLGNNNYDVIMNARDGSPFTGVPVAGDFLSTFTDINALFNIGIRQRGQNNAVGAFEVLVTVLDLDSLGLNPNPVKMLVGPSGVQDSAHPLAHTQDTPPWWNMGFRPRKFFDAGVSNDSIRIIMAAGPGEFSHLVSEDGKAYRDRIREFARSLESYFLTLSSPPYPGEIDENLARQGAILFHNKDLWADPRNASLPRPAGGNGSCASCHGVYSPQFAHDPRFLEDPAFIGIASNIAPLELIGTDPARSDMLTPTLRERWDMTYWGYNDRTPGWVAPEDKDPLTERLDDLFVNRPVGVCGWQKEIIGYQAPPLHGVWATAPYFHNGSVPTLEQVLDSSQRPVLWQRKIQRIGPIAGFDQRLSTAYDFERVGWKHDVLSCQDIPGTQLFNCHPLNDRGPSLVQIVENLLHNSFYLSGLLRIPDPHPQAFEKRLVFDTRILGNGKEGHTFSDVLSPQERRAIIEYLKTL